MFLSAGEIVGLVVDREPAAAETAVVQLDLLRHARAKARNHEIPERRDVFGQQVHVIKSARAGSLRMVTARHVFKGRCIVGCRLIAHRFPIEFEDMAKRVLEPKRTAVAQVTLDPSVHLVRARLDRSDPALQRDRR